MSARLTAGVRHALLAAAVLAVPAWGQIPADLNLFGSPPEKKPPPEPQPNPVVGFLVRALGGPGPKKSETAAAQPALSLPHALTFQDGRELRGELVSLVKGEIVWKRADASEPLKFTRAEVRRITLSDEAAGPYAQVQTIEVVEPGFRLGKAKESAKPTSATVKLPGGDWLYADVTSADGETLQLSLGGESKFAVPRSAVEWLHFGLSPAPAATLSSGTMALEGWVRPTPKGTVEEKEGWLTVKDVDWIGRNVSPPSRFEVAFDLQADDKQNTTLWIQPFGPQPNCYGRGTVELRLSPTEISRCIYINNIAHEKSPMPKDAGPGNTASFRALYDGVDGKLILLRNGKVVGDWKLKDDKEDPAVNRAWDQRGVNGICIHRPSGPVLGKFRIQPWDGTVPKEGEAVPAEDRLSLGKDAPLTGKLEAITATELVFSGAKKTRGAGTFLQLSSRPKAMAGADAQLFFGHRGELGAADLEVRDGWVSFRSSFAEKIQAPLKALPMISFTPVEARPAASGALVFKNGDELPGTLLSAGTGGALKWKTATGQEIEFQAARVAGVRFANDTKETEGSLLELANGDRLRGDLAALNEKQLQLKHALLGLLNIDRERLRTLYPSPRTKILDAGSDPASWSESGTLVNLDGKYAVRSSLQQNNFYTSAGRAGVSRELKGMPDKFELRCEAVDFSGNEPNLGIWMSSLGTGSQSSLNLDLNYGSLRIHGWVSSGRSRSFWRDVALRNRNGRYEPEPRSSVRLFIDNKAGTVDVYVNGIHRAKTGQNANERAPGIAGRVTIGGYGNSNVPVVISDIWVGPWNGELPKPGEPPTVALSNGDVAEALPKELKNGKLVVDPGGGDLELPVEKVDCITFGAAPEPTAAPGRLRLAGGDTVSVESFRFAGGELTAKSKTLGDVRLPAKSIRELVFDAAPATFPMIIDPKKKAHPEGPPAPAAAIEQIR